MRKEKAKIIFSPFRKFNPVLIETQKGELIELPVKKTKRGYEAYGGSRYLAVPSVLAKTLYDIDSDTDIVIINRGKNIAYEITDYELAGLSTVIRNLGKDELKVYETPPKMLQKVAEVFEEAYRQGIKEGLKDSTLRDLLKYRNEETVLRTSENRLNEKQKEVLKLMIELERRKGKEFFKYIYENWERIKKLSSSIYLQRVEKPHMVIFDPQAGSGKILQHLPENATLTGFEIRGIENRDQRYKVLTHADSNAMFDIIEREGWIYRSLSFPYANATVYHENFSKFLSNVEIPKEVVRPSERLIATSFYYVNPPYEGDKRTLMETFASIPTLHGGVGSIVVGLISKNNKFVIDKYFTHAVYWEVPKNVVGYTEKEAPEEFIFFIGVNDKGKDLFSSSITKNLGRVNSLDEIDVKYAIEWLKERVSEPNFLTRCVHDQSRGHEYFVKLLKELKEKLNREIEEMITDEGKEIEKKKAKEALKPLSIISRALKDEPVFPALHLRENGIFMTFKEIAGNPELLKIYKSKYPEIYEIVKEVSKRRAIPLALVEREREEYTVASIDRLGLVKYKYLPQIIELTDDLKKLILNKLIVDDEERDKLERAFDVSKYVFIKNNFTSTVKTGEETFGYEAVVCLADEKGQTVAVLDIPVDGFYEYLLEEGIVKLGVKHISQHPEYKKALKELIVKFAEDLKRNEIFDEEEKEIINRLRLEGKKPSEIAGEVYGIWKKKRKEFADLFFKFNVSEEIKAGVRLVLKARGKENLYTSSLKVIDEIENIYQKAPVSFLSNLYEVIDKEFCEEFFRGKSIKEYLKERLIEEGIDEITADEIAGIFVEKHEVEKTIVENSINSIDKLIRAYLLSNKLIEYAEKDLKRAEVLFEQIHTKIFKLLPHQYEEALNVAIKAYLTGEPGHLLGWEMRSGKTLAMALAGYFSSLLNGNKTYMFVRSANLYDIAKQIIFFLPHMARDMVVYPNQELASKVFGREITVRALSDKAYPNIFKETRLFKGKGTTVNKLLEEEPFVKIERFAREGFNTEEVIGKPYEGLLYLEGYDKGLLKGLVRYIYENEENFVMDKKVWEDFIKRVSRFGKDIKDAEKHKGKRFHLVSKETYLLSVNYRLRRDRKKLGENVETNGDVEIEIIGIEEWKDYMEEEYGNILVMDQSEYEDLSDEEKEKAFPVGTYMDSEDEEGVLYAIREEDLRYPLRRTVRLPRLLEGIMLKNSKEKRRIIEGIKYGIKKLELELPFVIPTYDIQRKSFIKPLHDEGITVIRTITGVKGFGVFYNLEGTPPIYESLKSNARSVIYESGIFDGHNFIVDEIDQSSNKTSETYKVIKSINSPLKIASTGTVSNGTVQSTVELLGLISDISYDAISRLSSTVKELYGTYTISDSFENFYKSLFRVFMKAREERKLRELVDLIYNFESFTEFVRGLYELNLMEDSIEESFAKILSRIEDSEEVLNKIARIFKRFKDELNARLSSYMQSSFENEVLQTLFDVMKKERVLKEGVGTLNPISFVKSLDLGVSLSLITRQALKKRIEVLNVLDELRKDLIFYEKTRAEWKYRLEEGAIGKLRVLEDLKGKKEDMFLAQTFRLLEMEKKNNSGASENTLRVFFDATRLISFASGKVRTLIPITLLETRFQALLRVVEALQERMYQDEELKELVSRSGKTTNDDLVSLVREYILNDYSFENEKRDVNELSLNLLEKQELVREVVEGLKNAKTRIEKYEVDGEEKEIRYISITIRGKEYLIPESEVKADAIDVSVAVGGTYSLEVDLSAGRNWKREIFKDLNPSYKYRLKIVSSKDDEIIDVITNKGYMKSIEKEIKEEKDFVVATSRVNVLPVIAVDAINLALESKSDKPFEVVVRVSNPEQKKFFERINREFLESKGIYLKVINTQAELDTMMMRARENKGKIQTVVIAPAQTIARGVDFSMMDTMIVAGTMEGKGKEFTQLLARLYNNTDKHEANIYVFGTPVRLRFIETINETLESKEAPTISSKVQAKLLSKAEFARDILDGKLSRVREYTRKVEFSPQYEFLANREEYDLRTKLHV